MSYVDSNLLAGEKVHFRTHLHWRLYVMPVIATVALFFPTAWQLAYGTFVPWVLLLPVVGVLWVLAAHLRRSSSEFAVTNKRVVIKLGVMSTRSIELLLTKVEGIAVNQDLFGKMLGYGEIVVTGSGGTKEAFSNIQDPFGLRRAIQDATDARERPENG